MFDKLYSLVKGFNLLPPPCKNLLVDTLRSNFSVLLPSIDSLSRSVTSPVSSPCPVSNGVERIASHRNALKIYTFLLLTIALLEDSEACSQEQGNAGGRASKVKDLFYKLKISILSHLSQFNF